MPQFPAFLPTQARVFVYTIMASHMLCDAQSACNSSPRSGENQSGADRVDRRRNFLPAV